MNQFEPLTNTPPACLLAKHGELRRALSPPAKQLGIWLVVMKLDVKGFGMHGTIPSSDSAGRSIIMFGFRDIVLGLLGDWIRWTLQFWQGANIFKSLMSSDTSTNDIHFFAHLLILHLRRYDFDILNFLPFYCCFGSKFTVLRPSDSLDSNFPLHHSSIWM